jgi:hypothetical protein
MTTPQAQALPTASSSTNSSSSSTTSSSSSTNYISGSTVSSSTASSFTNASPHHGSNAKGVKKVPFDGTQENFYLWTTQLLGFAETYNCEQALLGKLTVPASTDVLDPTKAD